MITRRRNLLRVEWRSSHHACYTFEGVCLRHFATGVICWYLQPRAQMKHARNSHARCTPTCSDAAHGIAKVRAVRPVSTVQTGMFTRVSIQTIDSVRRAWRKRETNLLANVDRVRHPLATITTKCHVILTLVRLSQKHTGKRIFDFVYVYTNFEGRAHVSTCIGPVCSDKCTKPVVGWQ